MRRLLALAVAVLLSVPVALWAEPSACVSCHRALDRRNAEPALLWQGDLHREAGLGCQDCHGGDPGSLVTAMLPSHGFMGAPDKEGSLRLCGNCHSEPARMPDPGIATDQMEKLLSGPHGPSAGEGGPTCVRCHGSHGIRRVTDPSSPVFRTSTVDLCIGCHDREAGEGGETGPLRYLDDVHGRSLIQGTNPRAPTCADCHGAHRAAALTIMGTQMVCGSCHTMEYRYFQAGPHAASLRQAGEPSCSTCHGYHGIEATGMEEIIGRIADNCKGCHAIGGDAWNTAQQMDEGLGVAMSFLGSLRDKSAQFRRDGLETGEMDRLNQEALGWLLQVESAIHSVDTDWEELTGMAKVKMMASWDVARDYSLERGLRRFILLIVVLLAVFIFALLAYKLKLAEKDQHRRQLLGSPEARQREQEHHRK